MQLTDTLKDSTYTPSVVGGGGSSNVLGGLAQVGAGFLDMFSKQQRSQRTDDDNPALDELASASFTILSNGNGPHKGAATMLAKAEKIQKAHSDGNMKTTAYSMAMNGIVNDIIQRYPGEAEEILAWGGARGLDNYYFRGAKLEMEEENNQIAQQREADNKAFQHAASMGVYDPNTTSYQQAVARGYTLLAEDAAKDMAKAERDKLLQLQQIGQPWWDERFKEVSNEIVRQTMGKVYTTTDIGMEQIYALVERAGTDPDKLALIDKNYGQALLDLDKLNGDVRRALNAQGQQYVTNDETGEIRVVPIPEEALKQAEAEIKVQKEIITWLRAQPLEEQKRYIEMTTLNAKVKANEYVPTIMEMANGLGMSVPQVLQTLMVNPNAFGLDTKASGYIFDEMAKGARKWSDQSLQFTLEMTNKGQSPAFSSNPEKALKGFMDNINMTNMLGASLVKGGITDEADREATLEGFANNASSVVAYMRTKYNASNINVTNANNALNNLFNDKAVKMLDAFVAQGGDADVAEMMGAQLAITAVTFVEALANNPNLKYNKSLGIYEALPQKMMSVGGMSAGSQGSPYQVNGTQFNKLDQNLARILNGHLDFIERVHEKYPVLKEEFLKAGETNVRDVAAMQGFDAYAKAVQAKMNEEATIKRQQDQRFEQGVRDFDFYKDGSFNLDNSPTGDGGFRSAPSGEFNLNVKIPEEYEGIVTSSAEENNVDPMLLAALLKNESAWNPGALGPKIQKYAGTEDEQAKGIAQFLTSTARDVGVTDPMDPNQAIPGAAKYLRQQLDEFNDDPALALMAYNWGPGNVRKWLNGGQNISKIPKQTVEYVKRILGVDLTKGN